MGQSLSARRTPPTPTSASASVPNSAYTPPRSLPRRIISSIPKPSLRSRSLFAQPAQPEQTLTAKNRRWWPSRRVPVPAGSESTVPERMDSILEHDKHQVDRDVDQFGVITHRVPDNHSDSPAPSAKGKEKAKDISDFDNNFQDDDDDAPIPSTSTPSPCAQLGPSTDHLDNDQVVIAPTDPPSPPSLPPSLDSERTFVLPPSMPTPPPPPSPHPSTQQTNTSPRPFPPPGTLVVVQGVVHTTDVLRSSERPTTTSNPTPPITNVVSSSNTGTNFDTNSARPSSVPPATRSRNPLSSVFPRPSSMVPVVPSPSPAEPPIAPSNIDPQGRQGVSNQNGISDDSEDEDRTHTHPHGISMAQGPAGASGLSASSVDVLGTLLSVAAAATAASLLTGSSEPIFSSGLTSSHPPSPPNVTSQTMGLNSNVPSERPLSPTPTSDAGRMRHVWSSLRDRLGLGSGVHSSNQPNDSLGSGQEAPSPSSDVQSRDPREIMLAEMARAFNLGLGLGGSTSAPTVPAGPDFAIPDDGSVPTGDREAEQPPLPPPDSFERFLMDLQTDLRVTLMQEQESNVPEEDPRDADETTEDVEEHSLPDLQSISDSDSDEFESQLADSDENESDREDVDDEGNEEDVQTAEEQLGGRTSPAVSALGSGIYSPFGLRARSPSSVRAVPPTAQSQPTSTAMPPTVEGENNSVLDHSRNRSIHATHASSSVAVRKGVDDSRPSDLPFAESPGAEVDRAVVGMAHSPHAPNERQRVEAEGGPAIAVPPHDAQDPSNVPEIREFFLPGPSSLSGPSTSNAPNSLSEGLASTIQVPTQPPISTSPFSDPTALSSPPPGDSSMPFRLPFTPSSASRTEHTPGGGINWWRMYRFPAITPPNAGQQGGPVGSSSLSQSPFRIPAQGPSHSSASPWIRSSDRNRQNEITVPHGVPEVPGVHSGLAQPAFTPPAATFTHMPEIVSSPDQSTPPFTNVQDFNPPMNTSTNPVEHRSNIVVPVIVVGLQSVNMERQPPHIPQPPTTHVPPIDGEDDGIDIDSLEQPMSMPLHIPEPAEFRHHSNPLHATRQEHGGQQPVRGRTWHSRAANAIRNLRPSRRNTDAPDPQPQEPPGSRTFLIYVIGGYYPPDHQIITGGNLDSFEALWELAELLGQVKPPTASKEDIENSGLEIIKASVLQEYEKQGRVASNCIDRCLICLDDYDPEDELRVLTCKHTFHQGCVDRWLETGRNNCPACRTKGVFNESTGPTPATLHDI